MFPLLLQIFQIAFLPVNLHHFAGEMFGTELQQIHIHVTDNYMDI